ncbi:collagen-binding domain-containing protein [Companilactobacillus sp.]|uniref:collagen-binding domain-containing protein n=1 Tax=Companilactobacillus sp. TaxID=2767905 RepID=UPI00260EA7D9|nr:collagen-binding domain-containing protein [Companilactobacillus sp.]
MNSRYVKGTKWALSSVATCAAALSFLIVSNSSLADTNDQTNQNTVQTAQVQATTSNEAATDDVVDTDTTSQNEPATENTTNTNALDNENDGQAQTAEQPVATAANAEVPSGGTVYDDYPDVSNNPLGVAAYFHIFANDATLNAHTNGNLAVQNLDGKVNFGTNIHEELLDQEISYIQNITNIASSSFVSSGDTRTNKVVFGENVNIDVSNPNRVNVDGTNIDHLTASETYQDKDGQVYIDFAKEFQNLRDKSTELANMPTSNPTITNSDFDDMNNRVIDVSDYVVNEKNQIILNLDPEVLNSNTPLTIKGLSSSENGPTIIINVDTAGNSNYDVNTPIKIKYDDGSDRNSQETEYFGDNHLLWNFTDSTASNKLNNGTINVNAPFQGSVLAPNSTINVGQNLDGNIIADKVNVNAETHRWDLQDETRDEEENTFEKPDVTLPNVELPTPEEPEPETPGTTDPEEPEPETPGTTDPEEPEPETPGTTDPEEPEPEKPGTTDPDKPGITDPELPEVPGTTDPEEPEPETPGTTDPELPEVPGTTDPEEPEPETPGTTDPETPNVVDPDKPIEGENPGGPMIPADPDPDETESEEEDASLITDPDPEDNTSTKTPDKSATTDNGFVPNVPYENKKGTLPQTGSESSLILTAVGIALAAGLAFVIRRKRA